MVYNSMINACAKAGDIDRADHWLERMLEAVQRCGDVADMQVFFRLLTMGCRCIICIIN